MYTLSRLGRKKGSGHLPRPRGGSAWVFSVRAVGQTLPQQTPQAEMGSPDGNAYSAVKQKQAFADTGSLKTAELNKIRFFRWGPSQGL